LSAHKWFIIARNEYRIYTSAIRPIRSYFPYLALGLLAAYVTFVAPVLVNLFIDDFLAFMLTRAAVPMVQILLFVLFFYLMLFPISDTLRGAKTEELELILAAPLKSSDALFGEFLDKMPLYAIVITAITGTLTALLSPLGLDAAQNVTIIIMFVTTFLLALWIGTVFAAILRTKLGKTVRGKDFGRALSVVVVLPLIATMYAVMNGGLIEALTDHGTSGTVRGIIGLLPSSWGADIFVAFVSHPGNIGVGGLEVMTRLGGLVGFFLIMLLVGTRAADRAYSLESTAFTASVAMSDGFFYRTIRRLGGDGPSGIVLEATFKDYGRRLENLSWIAYSIGLMAIITASLSISDNAFLMTSRGVLLVTSEMAIPLLAGFTVGTVSRSRETLFIYKKSPRGLGRFVKARLMRDCLMTVPIAAAIIAVLTALVPQITPPSLMANILSGSIRTAGSVAFLLGLALLIPVFADESKARARGVMVNLQVIIFATIGLEIGLDERRLFPGMDLYAGTLLAHLLQTMIISSAGIALLYLGKKRMGSIE